MLKTLLSLCLLLFFNHVQAQVLTDSTLVITSYWKVGDVFTYSVTQQETTVKGKKERLQNTSYSMRLEVIKETQSSYIIDCTYSDFETDSKLSKEEQKVVDLYDGLVVRYKVSEYGDFLEIKNWKEIRSMAEDLVRASLSEKADTMSDSTINSILELTMAQFSSKDQIETYLIQDIRQLHYLHRTILYRNRNNDYEKYYVNPFMDEDFIGTESYTIEDIDAFDEMAFLNIQAELPKESTQHLLRNYMENLIEGMGGSANELNDDDIPSYSIRESYRYEVDYDLGVVVKLSYKKKTLGKNNSNAISYKYKLID